MLVLRADFGKSIIQCVGDFRRVVLVVPHDVFGCYTFVRLELVQAATQCLECDISPLLRKLVGLGPAESSIWILIWESLAVSRRNEKRTLTWLKKLTPCHSEGIAVVA